MGSKSGLLLNWNKNYFWIPKLEADLTLTFYMFLHSFQWLKEKKSQGHHQCIMRVRRGQSNFTLYKEYIDARGTVTCNDPYSSALPFVLFLIGPFCASKTTG
ncbi:hypothetical protein GDO78_001309 [Eleutherodactylus coqui]|uniref:Uncharacterized protein n=1 Tax=Eleutherodactylus coqui TaxID=57060 RepID=A0A8J6FSU4_ELECQ|nr:hypothetical protein GDO78_001309 [Eleutherodactylus coqui]